MDRRHPLNAITVTNLSYSYPHHGTVLTDLNFEIVAGERVGIIGPNGAGKSTLLLHLNGLLLGQGTVSITGTTVNKSSLAEIRAQVGLVFADPEDQLFMPTLIEDAAFGPLNLGQSPQAALKSAEQALDQVRLLEKKDHSGHHLSDGERRRAAIATVLSMQPKIWVLDEPAANLDPRGRRELIAILNALPGTVILASHDLDLVLQVCKRCLLLDHGEIIKDGPATEILGNPSLMEKHGLEVPLRLNQAISGQGVVTFSK